MKKITTAAAFAAAAVSLTACSSGHSAGSSSPSSASAHTAIKVDYVESEAARYDKALRDSGPVNPFANRTGYGTRCGTSAGVGSWDRGDVSKTHNMYDAVRPRSNNVPCSTLNDVPEVVYDASLVQGARSLPNGFEVNLLDIGGGRRVPYRCHFTSAPGLTSCRQESGALSFDVYLPKVEDAVQAGG